MVDNTANPIKAAPTARGDTHLDGMRNILEDALYEMGYDGTLVNTLIERNIIDFTTVDYTSDIKYQLEEHYGDAVVWPDLEDAVACEGLDIFLAGELAESWDAAFGDAFIERIRHVITDPIEKLGMTVITRYELVKDSILPEELERVKQHLTIDYGEFNSCLPYIDFVIYNPENLHVIAVVSCMVNLKNKIFSTVYWKFKLQENENKASVKFYLITTDIDKTLQITDVPKLGRAVIETDLDGTYVLTTEALEESDKVKLFEHFIEDLKQVIEESK